MGTKGKHWKRNKITILEGEKNGMFGKIPWNKGKKGFRKGHIVSEAARKAISIGRKEYLRNNPQAIEDIRLVHLGKTKSEEHKNKLKRIKKQPNQGFQKGHKIFPGTEATQFKKGQPSSRKGKNNKEIYGEEKAKEISIKLSEMSKYVVHPTKDTEIEKRLQQQLTEAGIPFITHYPIRGQPDIYIPIGAINNKRPICIFADGCYWHKCPICRNGKYSVYGKGIDFWIKYELELEGNIVSRFWEHDIRQSEFDIVERIVKII
jgi:G:T-mismatch repair DNA endonuclease (very short patch repair protein)